MSQIPNASKYRSQTQLRGNGSTSQRSRPPRARHQPHRPSHPATTNGSSLDTSDIMLVAGGIAFVVLVLIILF